MISLGKVQEKNQTGVWREGELVSEAGAVWIHHVKLAFSRSVSSFLYAALYGKLDI